MTPRLYLLAFMVLGLGGCGKQKPKIKHITIHHFMADGKPYYVQNWAYSNKQNLASLKKYTLNNKYDTLNRIENILIYNPSEYYQKARKEQLKEIQITEEAFDKAEEELDK